MNKIIFLILLMMSLTAWAAEEPSVRVEGIMYDGPNPERSMVVIDGGVYRQGDRYQTFEIRKINAENIEVVNQTSGETVFVQVQRDTSRDAVRNTPDKPSNPSAAPAQTPKSSNPLENLFGELFGKAMHLSTPMIEMKANMELRKIYAAALQYSVSRDLQLQNLEIKTLVREGLLSRDYEEGVKEPYKFRIVVTGRGVQVFADPEPDDGSLKHFLLDDEGTLYFEYKKSATRDSSFQK
jgi:hypothetical protein